MSILESILSITMKFIYPPKDLSLIDSDGVSLHGFFYHCFNVLPTIHRYVKNVDRQIMLNALRERFDLSDESLIYRTFHEHSPGIAPNPQHPKRLMEFAVQIREQFWVSSNYHNFEIYSGPAVSEADVEDVLACFRGMEESQPNQQDLFNMIMRNEYGYDLKAFQIRKHDIDLRANYNDDFSPVHERIETFLKEPNSNGIVLLHGLPGTGKTTYLRYLISTLNKKIIFLPPHLMDFMASPEFIPFITDYRDSILIVEDCEELLKPREQKMGGASSGLTNLLNIGDGLLADALSFKIVCTFNTDLRNIDQAILRKGRLIARYAFRALDTDKANQLAEKIGKEPSFTRPVTLAELYNAGEENFAEIPVDRKLGF